MNALTQLTRACAHFTDENLDHDLSPLTFDEHARLCRFADRIEHAVRNRLSTSERALHEFIEKQLQTMAEGGLRFRAIADFLLERPVGLSNDWCADCSDELNVICDTLNPHPRIARPA